MFRTFGTKKALFPELVGAAFDHFSDGMAQAANGTHGLDALALMGARYYKSLADRTTLLLQLQGLAAGMLLSTMAALDAGELDEPWARGVRTRIHPGLFRHITADTNR